jgi:hypothetical protein
MAAWFRNTTLWFNITENQKHQFCLSLKDPNFWKEKWSLEYSRNGCQYVEDINTFLENIARLFLRIVNQLLLRFKIHHRRERERETDEKAKFACLFKVSTPIHKQPVSPAFRRVPFTCQIRFRTKKFEISFRTVTGESYANLTTA